MFNHDLDPSAERAWSGGSFPWWHRRFTRFDQLDPTCPGLRAVADMARTGDVPRILVLRGGHGTGKTQAATLLARSMLARKWGVHYGTAQELLHEVYDSLFRGEAGAVRRRQRAVKLLVIDEVNIHQGRDKDLIELRDLIDCRDRSGAHTVLITNLEEDALLSNLGPAIADRLVESGLIVSFNCPSQRKAPS